MRAVTDDARYLMLYLLTSHRNIMIYFLPSPYACFDLGGVNNGLVKLQELLQTDVIQHDQQLTLFLFRTI